MNLGTLAPLLAQVATPVLAEALGNGKPAVAGISALNDIAPALDVRAQLAAAEMREPSFWQPAAFDWQKAALVALVGFVAGHLVGRSLK